MDGVGIEKDDSSAECRSDKPTALLASASRVESLITWLHRNANAMVGRSFVAPGELHQHLKWGKKRRGLAAC